MAFKAKLIPLSQAIREGAKEHPQGHGLAVLFAKDGTISTCALGASYVGVLDGLYIDHMKPKEARTPEDNEDFFREAHRIEQYWRKIKFFTVPLEMQPEDAKRPDQKAVSLATVIIRLNDGAKWSREKIADWVESVENHLGDQAYPLSPL